MDLRSGQDISTTAGSVGGREDEVRETKKEEVPFLSRSLSPCLSLDFVSLDFIPLEPITPHRIACRQW